jgi:hypothetical protein
MELQHHQQRWRQQRERATLLRREMRWTRSLLLKQQQLLLLLLFVPLLVLQVAVLALMLPGDLTAGVRALTKALPAAWVMTQPQMRMLLLVRAVQLTQPHQLQELHQPVLQPPVLPGMCSLVLLQALMMMLMLTFILALMQRGTMGIVMMVTVVMAVKTCPVLVTPRHQCRHHWQAQMQLHQASMKTCRRSSSSSSSKKSCTSSSRSLDSRI